MLALGWPTTEVDLSGTTVRHPIARLAGPTHQPRPRVDRRQASGHHDQVDDIIGTGEEATALWREPTVKLQ